MNPYGPQPPGWGGQVPGVPQLDPRKWICNACRHENEAHYDFCLGCGGGRGGGQGERREGPVEGARQERNPMALIGLVVGIVVAIAAGVVAFLVSR